MTTALPAEVEEKLKVYRAIQTGECLSNVVDKFSLHLIHDLFPSITQTFKQYTVESNKL